MHQISRSLGGLTIGAAPRSYDRREKDVTAVRRVVLGTGDSSVLMNVASEWITLLRPDTSYTVDIVAVSGFGRSPVLSTTVKTLQQSFGNLMILLNFWPWYLVIINPSVVYISCCIFYNDLKRVINGIIILCFILKKFELKFLLLMMLTHFILWIKLWFIFIIITYQERSSVDYSF